MNIKKTESKSSEESESRDSSESNEPPDLNYLGVYVEWKQGCNLGPPPFSFIPIFGPGSGDVIRKQHGDLVEYASATQWDDTQANGITCLPNWNALKFKMENNEAWLSPEESKLLQVYYDGLQYVLYETGSSETKDKTGRCDELRAVLTKVDKYRNRIAVVVFARPAHCLGILLEGCRQCPGDLLLVLSSSWLFKVSLNESPRVCAIYVSKAIVFKSGKRSQLKHFYPPRRATYLVNLLTSDSTGGACRAGDELEKDIDCPMGISLKLSQLMDDKLWTRIKMAEVGMAFPETLAIVYKPGVAYTAREIETITMVVLQDRRGKAELIMECLRGFIGQPYMRRHSMIIVKPSGRKWSGSQYVTSHDKRDFQQIYQAALDLLPKLEEGDSILVEAFYETLQGGNKRTTYEQPSYYPFNWRATSEHAARVRATVVKTADNRSKCSKIVCGVWYHGSPVHGCNTMPMDLPTLLTTFGVTDPPEHQSLQCRIRRDSENLLDCLTEHVETLGWEEKGAWRAECDVIGIDFVISDIEGVIVPVAIEVNGANCVHNCGVSEFTHPAEEGEAFADNVSYMIMKSYEFMLSGKIILVIGPHPSHYDLLQKAARDYSVKLTIVDSNLKNRSLWESFADLVVYDYSDSCLDPTHAANIMQFVKKENLDACITFNPMHSRLASLVTAQLLGLADGIAHNSLKRLSVQSVQEALRLSNTNMPHRPPAKLYALQQVRARDAAQRETICSFRITKAIHFKEDEESQPAAENERNLKLAPRYRAYLALYKRKKVMAFTCDVAYSDATANPDLMLTMPSRAPQNIQDVIVCAAYQCCVEVGLASGVFVTEFSLTATGPKLLHVHSVLDSLYVAPWIKIVYGVDILFFALLITCDIPPFAAVKLFNSTKQIIGIITNKIKPASELSAHWKNETRCGKSSARDPLGCERDNNGDYMRLCSTCQLLGTCAGDSYAVTTMPDLINGELHNWLQKDRNSFYSLTSPNSNGIYDVRKPICSRKSRDIKILEHFFLSDVFKDSLKPRVCCKVSGLNEGNAGLLKALEAKGVVVAERPVLDWTMSNEGSLIFSQSDYLKSCLDCLCDGLSAIDVGDMATRLSSFVMDFKDFNS